MDSFKRYDAYALFTSQRFIDSRLPVCPFCKSNTPHWLLRAQEDEGRTYYQCECCQATLSSDTETILRKNPRMPDDGNPCMRVEALGSACTDEMPVGRVVSIPYLQKMAIPSTVFCPRCGRPQHRNNAFCSACGTKLPPAAPMRPMPPQPENRPPMPPSQPPVAAPAPAEAPAPIAQEMSTAPEAPAPVAPEMPAAQEAPAPVYAEPLAAAQRPVPTSCYWEEPAINENSSRVRLSIAALVMASLSTLYVFFVMVGNLINYTYLPLLVSNALSLIPYVLMVTGLAVCRKQRNILFGSAMVLMGLLECYAVLVPLLLNDHASLALARLLTVVPYIAIGTSYLVAKRWMRIIKLVCAILILLLSLTSLANSGAVIFGTVLPMVTVIVYTPFKKRK